MLLFNVLQMERVSIMPKSCQCCAADVSEPFIRCVHCKPHVDMCLLCFSKGREFGSHKSSHDYEVKQSNFSVTEEAWTAAEDMKLLISLLDLGFGNWREISKQVRTKSSVECKRHYMKNFIENPIFDTVSTSQFNATSSEFQGGKEIVFKACEDPPRPPPMSDMATEMAGYMPCRGDFDTEYDNFAETSIKDIEFDNMDDDLLKELKFVAIEIFHSRMKERSFRKRIVRKHGLINQLKDTSASLSRQERFIRDSLRVFSRLQPPEHTEIFIQGLLVQYNLMKHIKSLQSYRKAGLKRKQAASIHKKLNNERKDVKSKRTMQNEISCFLDVPISCQLWLQKHLQANANTKVPSMSPVIFPQIARKPAARLELSGMPGVEILSHDEKELCSLLRIAPLQYTIHKNTLIRESQRLGSLRLQQARPLIKIDVNKTKRLFDFCIEQGWINNNNNNNDNND